MNLYETLSLLRVSEQIAPVPSFLRDTFFPNSDTLLTEHVLLESVKGNRKVAPFVAPQVGGVTVDRQGRTMSSIVAPRIAPQRVLDVQDIQTRGLGESLISTRTPAEREMEIVARDLRELSDMIGRREELMIRDLLFTGKVTVKGYVDEAEKNYVSDEINYNSVKVKTPSVKWGQSGAKILEDLRGWRLEVIKNMGTAPNVAIISSELVNILLGDEKVQKLLDVRNYDVGKLAPVVQNAAVAYIGTFPSIGLDIYTYDEWYYDEEKEEEVPMIPAGHILLGSRNLGERRYGVVTQMEQDQNFRSYEGALVPKVWADIGSDRKMIRLTSRPVPVPFNLDSWAVAKVLG